MRAIVGWVWAALMVPLILAVFFGFDGWSRGLASGTGVKVSPWYTGGEVVRALRRDGYTVLIHEPVFGALIGERDRGFVQVRLQPAGVSLPATVDERLDLDGDGADDVRLEIDTRAGTVRQQALGPRVAGEPTLIDLGVAKVVRVPLYNTGRP